MEHLRLQAEVPLGLSVVMPAHNEARTLKRAVDEVLCADFGGATVQLIVIDDGSTDDTWKILHEINDPRVLVLRHPTNLGKGAAVLTGVAAAAGPYLVIFDADGEYRASDLKRMLEPIRAGHAEVVYGTRLFGMNTVYQSYRYALGNRATTFAANIIFDSALSDLHTCLKMMPVSLFRELHLTQTGFGLDSEITAELLRRGHRPFEVPVSYHSRSHAQGKKLTWRDGVDCLLVLGRVRLRGRIRVTPELVPTVEDMLVNSRLIQTVPDVVDSALACSERAEVDLEIIDVSNDGQLIIERPFG